VGGNQDSLLPEMKRSNVPLRGIGDAAAQQQPLKHKMYPISFR
jgi:hypothetical protein